MEKIEPAIKSFRKFTWTDIYNPDKHGLDKVANQYGLDYYQVLDSLEQGHLPKFEKQPNYNFLILRAFTSTIEQGATTIPDLSNKIAFFYNGDKMITTHRTKFDFLEKVDCDFNESEELLIYLISKMADTYRAPLHELDHQIAEFEKMVFLKNNSKVALADLYFLKTQTRITKKLLLLFQDVIHQIEVGEKNRTGLQDIKDGILSLILSYDEVLENARNLVNAYHSVSAQKTNDVMKLLTIFSAFFLPLTFIAGIYGMNFEYMPELKWGNGYFLIWGIMAVISTIIFLWFKRKRII